MFTSHCFVMPVCCTSDDVFLVGSRLLIIIIIHTFIKAPYFGDIVNKQCLYNNARVERRVSVGQSNRMYSCEKNSFQISLKCIMTGYGA